MVKKLKINKKKEILAILKEAAYAWDVTPKGTIEGAVIDKLVERLEKLIK